jgi:MFS family permease
VFGPYLVGNFVSSTGNWFQNVAAAYVVFTLTGSSTLVGVVGLFQFGATLLIAPVAGAAADRVDRRRLMVLAQVVSFAGAAALAALVLAVGVDGLPGAWPVFAATGVIGLGYAVTIPATQAIVPALVRRADLPQAIALGSVSFNLARAVGPALAGVLLATAGAGTAFTVNAASFAVFAVVLARLRPRHPTRLDADDGADRSIRAGLRVAITDPFIVRALLATAALGFATDPVNTLAPALADRYGAGGAFVGYVGSAFGAGAVGASLVLNRLRERFPRTRLAEVGYLALAVGMGTVALAPAAGVALAGMVVAGVGFLLAVTTVNGELQYRLDEEVRGRVMALWSVAFLGLRPVAALLDGAVSDGVGVGAGVAVAATLSTVAAVGLRVTRGIDPAPVSARST